MIRMIGNRRYRNAALQLVFVAFIITIVIVGVTTTRHNLQVQGVSMGWDFLHYSTGSTISFSLIDYDINSTFARALLVGFVNTIFLGVISVSLAVILGTIIGTARLSKHKLVNLMGATYVQVFRNIPLILQAFFWYSLIAHLPSPRSAIALPGSIYIANRGISFPWLNVEPWHVVLAAAFLVAGIILTVSSLRRTARSTALVWLAAGLICAAVALAMGRLDGLPLVDLPRAKGLRFVGGATMVPELSAAIVAISLFGAAYVAEIVRAGFLAIPTGLTEAAYALGLRNWDTFWRIRLPLMIRKILPTMTNQIIWLMKATTIGIAIGFSDYFGVIANSINHSGQTLTLIFLLIIGFWAINMSIAFVMNAINRSIALPGHKK
ncbi:Binding-protein-dependent transport systems inner membrane component [Mesorhizobium sp. SOD10]|nr:Binding-protein-dependent transport systems inner membrane component [Mesorhizobium sp. SOD10]